MPGKIDIRLRIKTHERRYIVQDVAPLEDLLQEHGTPIEYVPHRPETEITTIYFDTLEGTWSKGLSQTKLRARSYQDAEQWWFELKRREGTRVDKWRRPMSVSAVLATLSGEKRWKPVTKAIGQSLLVPMFGVQCRRTAFEWLGLRVTVDRDLAFFDVRAEQPLLIAQRIGRLAGIVVEVKGEGDVPTWLSDALNGHLAKGYSKSRYALALQAGLERPYLVADEVSAQAPLVAVAGTSK